MRDILRKLMVETPLRLPSVELLEPTNWRGEYEPLPSDEMMLHFIIYGLHEDGTRNEDDLRDIKEQTISFPKVADAKRAENIAQGWVRAVMTVLTNKQYVEMVMPEDFRIPKDVLSLKKATTPEDFEKAFLAKARFGKLL